MIINCNHSCSSCANASSIFRGIYKSQGRYSEAEPLYIQALDICERQLGVNHPNTVTVREGLAYLRDRLPSNPE
ncbi:tetratricopeptide repeat protein [Nostoc sphaeroides CCNUC1]|uniref:Tetratricopeptide repeat protein n=1 Tax=Nostoc sphaeroides CCNUC1 TaxID=2653204 RepID=A0A5P8W1S8_9NOSO|nr:tetratricopeptide repeat protein [Nostoc sphaeroides]QFS46551.1 tetratricopeptide repeat protein [Nostoc sphaeroides CCNUC1]